MQDLGDPGIEATTVASTVVPCAHTKKTTASNVSTRRGNGGTRGKAGPCSSQLKPEPESAATTAALQLAPVLARAGLLRENSRILRVVALYPSRRHAIGNNVISYPYDERTRGGEAAVRAVDRARYHVGGDEGSDRRRSGLGVVHHDERMSGAAATAVGDGVSQARVVVPEQNTPLCVSDVLRKALLRGNNALRRAVLDGNDSIADVMDDDGADSGAGGMGCGQAMGGLFRLSWTTKGSGNAQTIEGHGPCGQCRSVELDTPGESGGEQSTLCKGGPSIGVDKCNVVEADPQLLLSTAGLAWVLRPPFCGQPDPCPSDAESSPLDGDVPLKQRMGSSSSDSDHDGGSDHRHNVDTVNVSTVDHLGDLDSLPALAWSRLQSIVGTGVDFKGKDGSENEPRREALGQEVTWLSATPVGSRVYYCLEEAAWANAQQQHTRSTLKAEKRYMDTSVNPPLAVDTHVGLTKDTNSMRPSSSAELAHGNGRRTRQITRTDAPSTLGSPGAHHRDLVVETEELESDAKRTSAMVFARNVSDMLAAVYTESAGSVMADRETSWKEKDASKGRTRQQQKHQRSRTTKAGPRKSIVEDGGVMKTTCSLVVDAISDRHRHSPQFGASDGIEPSRQVLNALGAVPDVLVVTVKPPEGEPVRSPSSTATEHTSVDCTAARAMSVPEPRPGERATRRDETSKRASASAIASTPEAAISVDENEAAIAPPSVLHFAPARVLQLLGTPHCREFVRALPPAAHANPCLARGEDDPTSWSLRPPPIARLYVAMGGGHTPSSALDDAEGGEGDHCSGGVGTVPSAGQTTGSVTSIAAKDDSSHGSGDLFSFGNLPQRSPLIGTVLQPLSAHAMRELLQIYVATTRGVSSSTSTVDEKGRPLTSGLFFTPSTPLAAVATAAPASTRSDSDKVTRARDGAEHAKGARGQAAAACELRRRRRRPSGSSLESKSTLKDNPSRPSTDVLSRSSHDEASAVSRCHEVADSRLSVWEDAPSAATATFSGAESGLTSRSRSSDEADGAERSTAVTRGEDLCYYDPVAAVPPSALDIIPDSPSLCESSLGHLISSTMSGTITTGGRCGIANSVTTDNLIASSLRRRYHRAYVAVLAPPTVTAVGRVGPSKAVPASDNGLPGASAYFLQLEEAVDAASYEEKRRSDLRGCEGAVGRAACGRVNAGGDVGEVDAGRETKGTESRAESRAPIVCVWRGCLSDAQFG